MTNREEKFAVYLGEDTFQQTSGFVIERNFACVFEVVEQDATKNLTALNDRLSHFFYNNPTKSLMDFTNHLNSLLKHQPIKSFCAVYFYHNKLYAYTINALLFLHRNKKFYKVIEGNHHAVGSIEDKDLFILATSSFSRGISPS